METEDSPRPHRFSCCAFNFLASLINGNGCRTLLHQNTKKPFNFLASLINGNDSAGPAALQL